MMPTDADHPRGPARPGDGAFPAEVCVRGLTLHKGTRWARDEYIYEVRLTAAEIERLAIDPAPPAAPGAAAEALHEMAGRLRSDLKRWHGLDLSPAMAADLLAFTVTGLPGGPDRDAALARWTAPASALSGAEAVAEALYETERKSDDTLSWRELLALIGTRSAASIIAPHIIERYQKRAEAMLAILARLAVTKTDGAAPPVTVSDGASKDLPGAPAGPGLAGAVRLANAIERWSADGRLITEAEAQVMLDVALDGGAGGGWRRPCGVCFTPEACSSGQRCAAASQSAPPRSGQRGGDDAQG